MKVSVISVYGPLGMLYPRDVFTVIMADTVRALIETDTGSRHWVVNSFLRDEDGRTFDPAALFQPQETGSPEAVWWLAERPKCVAHPKLFKTEEEANRWADSVTVNPPVKLTALVPLSQLQAVERERDEALENCRATRGLLDYAEDSIARLERKWQFELERADTAEASLAAAQEALKPFAAIAGDYSEAEDDSFQVWKDFDTLGSSLPLSIFRRARAALAGSNPK